MAMLTTGWDAITPSDHPFRWATTEPGRLLSLTLARRLARDLPADEFVRREVTGRAEGKTYQNYSRVLAEPGGAAARGLPGLWHDLTAELLHPGYRQAVARLLGQPCARALEIRLVRHAAGDWLSPHTDRADKAFSHVIYLNEGWREEWGGCLQILASDDPADVVATVTPTLGTSALLARSDSSWHQVSRVTAGPDRMRASLLIHGMW